MSEPITLDTIVARRSDLPTADLDGETVLMSLESGAYFGFDPIGSRIWALLAEPRHVTELCTMLVAEYAVDMATCAEQVTGFLEELRREQLVRVVAP